MNEFTSAGITVNEWRSKNERHSLMVFNPAG
jgi:hypothetical protein